jgi:SAM-dependent methyltransferase
MPEPAALDAMKRALFKGSPKDFQPHVDLFRALGLKPGAAVLDFGCSWGYGSWQFMQAGFAVKGFEISEPRGKYARRMLGVEVVNDLEGLAGTFDLVFSSHVLEHVPAVAATLGRMRELLKPGGLLVILTPNGSAAYRKREPIFWRKAWGLKHPYFLDDGYYRSFFADWPYYLASGPADLEQVRVWAASSEQRMGDLGCSELRLIARKTASVTRGQG